MRHQNKNQFMPRGDTMAYSVVKAAQFSTRASFALLCDLRHKHDKRKSQWHECMCEYLRVGAIQ